MAAHQIFEQGAVGQSGRRSLQIIVTGSDKIFTERGFIALLQSLKNFRRVGINGGRVFKIFAVQIGQADVNRGAVAMVGKLIIGCKQARNGNFFSIIV